MACFSLTLLEQLLIWVVIFVAAFAIINLLLPLITRHATGTLAEAINIVIAIIRIVFWAAVVIVVIVFAFNMISCLVGHMPSLLPHR